MKYLLFGDIHGSEIEPIGKIIGSEEISHVICTGDFDLTKSIRDYIKLQGEHKEVIFTTVPGNHNHSLFIGRTLYSDRFITFKKDSSTLHEELMKDRKARNYLEKILNSSNTDNTPHGIKLFLDKERFNDSLSTIVVHGGLSGNLYSNSGCDNENKDLWYRNETVHEFKSNFDIMEKEGYNIIRGHDHEEKYVYKDSKGSVVQFYPIVNKSKYKLFRDSEHIINSGPFFEGCYSIINTNLEGEKAPILEYYSLE